MITLRIALDSPLCAASGVGKAAVVDRDVIFTAEGLPSVPGRRLKGLLRDAFEELCQSDAAPLFPPPELLFGKIGESFGDQIRVGNAALAEMDGEVFDSSSVGGWLRDSFDSERASERTRRAPFSRESVVTCFTEIRRQTAIDRSLGSPLKDTLRATRALKAGLVFVASLDGVADEWKPSLALAAAALRVMGTSRSRGLGQVSCCLMEGEQNLTRHFLNLLRTNSFPEWTSNVNPAIPQDATFANLEIGGDSTHVLRFTIALEQPAIFPSLDGDANTVLTYRYVPGSVVRGVLGSEYWKRQGRVLDESFYQLFCSGRVKFLSANPSIGGVRALPVPHSIRGVKSDPSREVRHFDLTRQDWPKDPDGNEEAVRRAEPFWAVIGKLLSDTRQQVDSVSVSTDLQYHHARAADNRIARPVGLEEAEAYALASEDVGALFTYESISKNQTFQGALLGPPEDLEKIQSAFPSRTHFSIGRSKSAQYGGRAEWQWDGKPQTVEVRSTEENRWSPVGDELESSTEVVVTLLSPMLTLNGRGHPVPEFPKEEFARAFKVSPEDVRIATQFARVHWQGGYLTHQRLPLQQYPAIASGSVFVLQMPRVVSPEEMLQASSQSFGFRIEDGFGRVAIRPQMLLGETECVTFREVPDKPVLRTVTAKADPVFRLLHSIFLKQLSESAAAESLRLARETANVDALSGHLISRLRQMLESSESLTQFAASLRQLKKAARSKLDRPMINSSQSLFDRLVTVAGNHEKECARLADKLLAEGWNTVFVNRSLLDQWNSEQIVKHYLLRYLAALSWIKRGNRPTKDATRETGRA